MAGKRYSHKIDLYENNNHKEYDELIDLYYTYFMMREFLAVVRKYFVKNNWMNHKLWEHLWGIKR